MGLTHKCRLLAALMALLAAHPATAFPIAEADASALLPGYQCMSPSAPPRQSEASELVGKGVLPPDALSNFHPVYAGPSTGSGFIGDLVMLGQPVLMKVPEHPSAGFVEIVIVRPDTNSVTGVARVPAWIQRDLLRPFQPATPGDACYPALDRNGMPGAIIKTGGPPRLPAGK